jgi:hypothetical protein
VTAISDDAGRFQLAVAGGRHRVGALGDGLSAPPLVVSLGAGESRELTLRMLGVGVLRGRVVHGTQPVAGARLTAGPGFASAVSQADGAFVLSAVPTGPLTLGVAPYRLRAPLELHVVAGENPPVELAVEPLARLHGVVHRSGVRGPPPQAAQADAQGRYVLEGLEAGAYQLEGDDTRLVAYTDGIRVSLALAEDRELDLELSKAGRATGQVVDAAGAPVASAHVTLVRQDRRDESHCVSDEHGAFVCGQLAGGAYAASVSPAAMGSAPFAFATAPRSVVLDGPQASVDGLRLVVVPTRRTIEGLVVDGAGEPIADARVQIATGAGDGPSTHALTSAPSGVSGLDGRFRIADLADGRYRLLVRTRDGSRSEHPNILAGSTDVRLVVAATCAELGEPEPTISARPETPVIWDDQLELLGWNVPATAHRDQDFEVTFVYRVRRPIDRSWRTFVHLDASGARAQADHEPLGGRCPMSSWQPGDLVVDRFPARFTADHPGGEYTVWTGFYVGWAGRWTNMPVSQSPAQRRDRHRIQLATITVH